MPYTSGTWIVKPGMEDAFVEAWSSLAEWSTSEMPGATWVILARDERDQNRFVSFGPWATREDIDAWRATPRFQAALVVLKDLIESVNVSVLDGVREFGSR